MKDVLIVDDSMVTRESMRAIIESDPDLRVAGMGTNGREAVDMVLELKPDVVVMDFQMPVMDGLAATRLIMERHPTPIVIVSAVLSPEETAQNFEALNAGALALVDKPRLGGDDEAEVMASIAHTIKLMSDVPVVRRRPHLLRPGQPELRPGDSAPASVRAAAFGAPPPAFAPVPAPGAPRLLAVGASTGGPQALRELLAPLPASFPVPIAVVQHISQGFLPGFVAWLGECTALRVKIAEHGEQLQAGEVYFAPDARHMGVDAALCVRLADDPPDRSLRPSVRHLFSSVAGAFSSRVLAVLLTGMGNDGAEEMLRLRTLGAVTVAQDKASSVVHGMPGAAIELGAAAHVLALGEMPRFFLRQCMGEGGHA